MVSTSLYSLVVLLQVIHCMTVHRNLMQKALSNRISVRSAHTITTMMVNIRNETTQRQASCLLNSVQVINCINQLCNFSR